MASDNTDQMHEDNATAVDSTTNEESHSNMVPTSTADLPDHGFLRSQVVAMFHEYMSEYMSTHSSPPTAPAAVPSSLTAPRVSTPGGGRNATISIERQDAGHSGTLESL
jgi:hypothetical protein